MGIGHAVEREEQDAGETRSLLTMNWQDPGDFLARTLGRGDVHALRCLYPKPGAPTPPRCSAGGNLGRGEVTAAQGRDCRRPA